MGYESRAKTGKACKYCGEEGLTWTQIDGRFRLRSPDGSLHACLGQGRTVPSGPISPLPISLKDFASSLGDEFEKVAEARVETAEPATPSILEALLAEL